MSKSYSGDKIEDIWTKIEKEPKTAEDRVSGSSVVVAGDLSSGKTTLINSFLKPKESKDTKPTIALDYNFARKVVGTTKSVANFWEIGGDIVEPRLIEIGITKENLANASAVVVCDLSKPHNILASLQRSIGAFKEIISKRAAELQATNVNQLTEIRNNVTMVYRTHIDTKRVRPTEVPIYIVANKFDSFKNLSSADRRSIYMILRFTAHYYGATILAVSSSDSGSKENFRALLNAISFNQPVKGGYEINPDKALYVTKGLDSFQNILLGGMTTESSADKDDKKPKNRLLSADADIELFLTNKGITKESWKRLAAHLSSLFGEPDPEPLSSSAAGKETIETSAVDSKQSAHDMDDENAHPEAEIDEMRAIRAEALRRYIQENERREEMIAKMNAKSTTTA